MAKDWLELGCLYIRLLTFGIQTFIGWDEFGQKLIAEHIDNPETVVNVMFVNLAHSSKPTCPSEYHQVMRCGFAVVWTILLI